MGSIKLLEALSGNEYLIYDLLRYLNVIIHHEFSIHTKRIVFPCNNWNLKHQPHFMKHLNTKILNVYVDWTVKCACIWMLHAKVLLQEWIRNADAEIQPCDYKEIMMQEKVQETGRTKIPECRIILDRGPLHSNQRLTLWTYGLLQA